MRIDYHSRREIMAGMGGPVDAVGRNMLKASLVDLVDVRASQLNGHIHSLTMHANEARIHGETDVRLDLIEGWRLDPALTERQTAALAWHEELTPLADREVSYERCESARAVFAEDERCSPMVAVAAINEWDRFAAALRAPVGHLMARASRAQV